jgi:hypothetical protein
MLRTHVRLDFRGYKRQSGGKNLKGRKVLTGADETVAEAATATPERAGRSWSWAALAWAALIDVLSIATFGMTVFLAPIGIALSAAAHRRAPHDGVFWIGLTLNALALLGLLATLIGMLTGEVGIGFE